MFYCTEGIEKRGPAIRRFTRVSSTLACIGFPKRAGALQRVPTGGGCNELQDAPNRVLRLVVRRKPLLRDGGALAPPNNNPNAAFRDAVFARIVLLVISRIIPVIHQNLCLRSPGCLKLAVGLSHRIIR